MLSRAPTIRLGDPAGAASAMIELVESPEPPLRQPLGTLAVEIIRQKLESQLAELEETAARGADG